MSKNSDRYEKRPNDAADKEAEDGRKENKREENETGFPQSVQELLSVEQPYVSEGTIKPDPEQPNTYIIEGNLLLPPNRKFRGHWTLRMTPSRAGAEKSTKTNIAFKIESVDQGRAHLSPAKVEESPEKVEADQPHEVLRAIKVAERILESIQIPIERQVPKKSVDDGIQGADFLPNVSSVIDRVNVGQQSRGKIGGQTLPNCLLSLPPKGEDHQSTAGSNLPPSVVSSSTTPESPGWPEKRKFVSATTNSASSSSSSGRDDSTASASTATNDESPGWPEKRRLTYNDSDFASSSSSSSYSDSIEADPLSTIFEESTQATTTTPQPPAAQNRRSRSRRRRSSADGERRRTNFDDKNGDQSPPSGDRYYGEDDEERQAPATRTQSEKRTSSGNDDKDDDRWKVASSPPPIEPASPEPTTTTVRAGKPKIGRGRQAMQSDKSDSDSEDHEIIRKIDEAIEQGRITIRRRLIIQTPTTPKKSAARRRRQTLSQKSGLIFPVNHFGERLLDEGYSSTPQRKDMKISLTAAIEFLVRDLLTSSVERTLSQNKKRITAPIVEETIKKDKILNKLLNNVILPKNPPPYRSKKG